MSLALARKYRPKRFADVAVQSHVSATLKGAIARGRVAHGYLLCGPRGTGKTTLARVLAMALNCENKPADGEPCGACPSCVHIWRGETSLDVVEIDAASNRGVDDARELRERAMYAPSGDDRYKVYIVDEAHMLTREAWNALLKILEEPPPRVVFVFATTEPQKIAQTAAPVLSRLQRFDLKRIGAADIRHQLQRVLGEERIEAEPEALAMVARAADGSMRDALSLTDQVLAMGEGEVTAERVREALGLVPEDEFLAVLDLISERRAGDVFAVVGRLADAGMDFGGFLGGLADMLRAQLAIVLGGAAPDVSERTRDALVAGRDRFSAPDLLRMLHALAEVEPRFRRSGQQQLLLETLLVRLALMDRSVELEDLLRGLGGEGGSPAGGRGTPARGASAPGAASPGRSGMSASAPPASPAPDAVAPAPRRPAPADVAVARGAPAPASPDDWRAQLADVAPPRGRPSPLTESPWGETETGGPPMSAGMTAGGAMAAAVTARAATSVDLQPPAPRVRATAGGLPAVELNRLVERWDDLVDAVRAGKPMLAAALQHATPVSVTGRGEVLLELDQPNEMMERAVNGSAAQLVQLLQEWFSGVSKVQLRAAAGAAGTPARRLTEQEVRQDQLEVLRRRDPVLGAAIDALDLDLVE